MIILLLLQGVGFYSLFKISLSSAPQSGHNAVTQGTLLTWRCRSYSRRNSRTMHTSKADYHGQSKKKGYSSTSSHSQCTEDTYWRWWPSWNRVCTLGKQILPMPELLIRNHGALRTPKALSINIDSTVVFGGHNSALNSKLKRPITDTSVA
jgi:hypothetical protein